MIEHSRLGPPPIPGREQRQSQRVDVEVAVDLQSDSNFYAGLIQNISTGGLFIATHMPWSVGDRVTVRFTLPNDSSPIECEAEVRWLRQPSSLRKVEGTTGMGVRFLNLPPAVKNAVNQFMKARDPLFFDDE